MEYYVRKIEILPGDILIDGDGNREVVKERFVGVEYKIKDCWFGKTSEEILGVFGDEE